jgi:hypothetical protein
MSLRYFDTIHARRQDSAEGRRLDERHVRVPVVIVWKIVWPGLDQGDFRNAVDMRVEGMHVEIAKARGEVSLVVWV